ncbi:MAG: DUF3783 domain-containing protein [Eggerthellaceae bacterium]|nr:DUF3783 domain-containing protein [Eggerthellaceae bacterium]
MAKKPKKNKASAAKKAVVSEPVAVLYNLDAGTLRGDAVRAVLAELGIRAKTASADVLGNPVGALVGLVGFHHLAKPFEGEAPQTEFMLLHNVKGERLSALLAAMREADAVVDCKAQVTQYNRVWPFAKLISEVSREHEAVNAAAAAVSEAAGGEE